MMKERTVTASRAGTKNNSRGFTLLEVMIGVAIMALILVFVYSAVNFVVAVGSDIQEQAKAANVLESAAEIVFSMSRTQTEYDSIVDVTYDGDDTDKIPTLASFRNPAVDVNVVTYSTDPEIKKVVIMFTWTTASQRGQRTQTLTTLVSRPVI